MNEPDLFPWSREIKYRNAAPSVEGQSQSASRSWRIMVMRNGQGKINREALSAIANSDQMAETEIMRINANSPSTITTNQTGTLIVIWVFAQPRYAPKTVTATPVDPNR